MDADRAIKTTILTQIYSGWKKDEISVINKRISQKICDTKKILKHPDEVNCVRYLT